MIDTHLASRRTRLTAFLFLMICFAVMLFTAQPVQAGESERAEVDSFSPEEALVFELQRKSFVGQPLVSLECLIEEDKRFFTSTTVDGVRWTVYGKAYPIDDGAMKIEARVSSYHGEERISTQKWITSIPIDDPKGLSAGALVSSVVTESWHYWIRRGVHSSPLSKHAADN